MTTSFSYVMAAWVVAMSSVASPASAQTAPSVTSSVVAVSDRKYTVHDYADPATKDFRVVIPEGLKTVRGLLVQCNYAGGDSRGDWTFCHYYREFLHLHGFALVASAGDIPHVKAFQAFRNCLQLVGVASHHPELVNAPNVAVGFSAGGGFASTLITQDPDRTIAAGIIEARYNFTALLPPNPPPSAAFLDAVLAIPSVLISGGKDNPDARTGIFKMVDEVFVPFRPKGAEYAWMVLPAYGHEYAENRQDLLIMPLLDHAVRARYPKDGDVTKGPIKLLAIDPASGWVADNTTWRSGITNIVPASHFKGDLGHSSWLEDEDIAFIYRAYATHDHPLAITSPGPCGPGTSAVDPGSSVPITVEAGQFPEWKKLELYDGAKKLGTVTAPPARFTAKDLTPGYHVFSVLGTDAAGTVRTSNPVMVIVRAPAGGEDPRELLADPGFERISLGRAESWDPYDRGYQVDTEVKRSGASAIRCSNRSTGERSGASVTLVLDQAAPAPILITGYSRAEGADGFPDSEYSIYVDLEHQDGTPLWGQTASFATGTHDWQRRQVLIVPRSPVRVARIYALFRRHSGTVWFDDFSASVLSGENFFDSQALSPPRLAPGTSAGWFARDAAAGSAVHPLIAESGDAAPGEDVLGLRLLRTTESDGGQVTRATVEDRTGKPRAVTIYYAERFEAEEPVWWNDIRDRSPAGSTGERANLTRIGVGATGSMSLYPFACVTGRGAGRMVGVVPLADPRVVRLGYHAGARIIFAAFDLALTGENVANGDGQGHGRAEVSIARAGVDPEWGFRSAAEKYYRLFPAAFERRAAAEGIWIPFTDPSTVKDVKDFGIAYHEGDNNIAGDDRLGILSFRYTEPMTWWMAMPRDAPRTYDDALGMVEKLAAGKDEEKRRWAQAVLSSGSRDSSGKFNVEFQDAPWTNGAVWALNPNPLLPHAPDEWTKARLSYTTEMADRMYGPEAKGIQDGEYLDSIEGWAEVLDFRPESIRFARTCPTFTTDGFRPVIPTWFSVWELAASMREDLHRRGKLLMANATPWRIHAFAPLLDVLGTETNWLPEGKFQPDSEAVFNLRRTLCFRKPYLLLQNTDFEKFGPAEVERYFQRSLFWGVYPSMFSADASSHPYWAEPRWYDRDRPLFKKYIPVIQRLSRAGWEPITFARSDDPRMEIERFGDRCLTVLNPSAEAITVTLRVEIHRFWNLPAGAKVQAVDMMSGEALGGAPARPEISVPISLKPDEARAMELRVEHGEGPRAR